MPVPYRALREVESPCDIGSVVLSTRPGEGAGPVRGQVEAGVRQRTEILEQGRTRGHRATNEGRAVEDDRRRLPRFVSILPPLVQCVRTEGVLGLADRPVECEDVATLFRNEVLQCIFDLHAIGAPRGRVILEDRPEVSDHGRGRVRFNHRPTTPTEERPRPGVHRCTCMHHGRQADEHHHEQREGTAHGLCQIA